MLIFAYLFVIWIFFACLIYTCLCIYELDVIIKYLSREIKQNKSILSFDSSFDRPFPNPYLKHILLLKEMLNIYHTFKCQSILLLLPVIYSTHFHYPINIFMYVCVNICVLMCGMCIFYFIINRMNVRAINLNFSLKSIHISLFYTYYMYVYNVVLIQGIFLLVA